MANDDDFSTWEPATKLIRGGLDRTKFGETSEPIFMTQSYVYDSAEAADARFAGDQPGFIYTRYGNPTVLAFEERLALLEGAEYCRGFATGMAAIHMALQGLVKAGDHIVAGRAMFGSCRWILQNWAPRFGVDVTLVDGPDLAQWKAAFRAQTTCVLIESPANPLLELTDISAVCDMAHATGAKVIVDNVFATPIFQRPLELGADVVAYSATKHIDGAGRAMGGALLGRKDLLEEAYRDLIRHTGPSLSPFNAWVLLKGMETLELRVRRQAETAAKLADQIAEHAKTKRIYYPFRTDHPQHALAKRQMTGGGTMVAFDLGGRTEAFNFLNALKIVDISNNLGDAKSMATHPSTTTHRAMSEQQRLEVGVTDGCVRLSVGLEGAKDLGRDIARALDKA